MPHAVRRDARQGAHDRGFDGPSRRGNKRVRGGSCSQPDASIVPSIALASEKTLAHEPLEDPGDRARMQMEDARELSSREIRALGHDPKDQALRTGDAKRRLHAFRRALEPMFDIPQQAHEVQNRVEVERSGRFGCRGGGTIRHGIGAFF
jgi:hypothetical protein